jgi:tetratricopeptide (TPR) repeat protein
MLRRRTLTNEIMTTRHPTARRVHRATTDPEDAFVAGVLESTAWAKAHSGMLLIGSITALALIFGSILFIVLGKGKAERAAVGLTRVRAVALSGNTELAIRDTEAFIADFGGTPAGDEARLLLAAAYLNAGRQQKAIETVSGLNDLDSDIGVSAANLVAAAHEAGGNSREAETALERIAADGRFLYQKQEALDNIARLRLQRGDVAGAVATYERLIELTPINAPERQVYELRLGEVRAMAAAGNTPVQAPAAQQNPPATPPATTTGG